MARCNYIIEYYQEAPCFLDALKRKKLVSIAEYRGHVIIARYGVNRKTLKKLIKKELD